MALSFFPNTGIDLSMDPQEVIDLSMDPQDVIAPEVIVISMDEEHEEDEEDEEDEAEVIDLSMVPVEGPAAKVPPNEFFCPISRELMTDPVVCSDGHTYDRAGIEEWLYWGNIRSPLTGLPLATVILVQNFALRSLIEAYHRAP